MTLGEKIISLRRARGLSQEELAITLGVSRQAVSKWEVGDATPDTDKIVALAEYFGVTTDWLLRDIEPAAADKEDLPSASELLHGAPMLLRLTTGGNLFGLSLLLYDAWQQTYYHIPSILGLLLQIGMSALFLGVCATLRGQGRSESAAWRARFWRVNIWLVTPLPFLLLGRSSLLAQLIPHELIVQAWKLLPIPLWDLGRLTVFAALPLALYVAVCLFFTLRLREKSK